MVASRSRQGARPSTINFEVQTIRAMLNVALECNYLRENPAKGIKILKNREKKHPRFLTLNECDRLLNNAIEPLKTILQVFLNSGMR